MTTTVPRSFEHPHHLLQQRGNLIGSDLVDPLNHGRFIFSVTRMGLVSKECDEFPKNPEVSRHSVCRQTPTFTERMRSDRLAGSVLKRR